MNQSTSTQETKLTFQQSMEKRLADVEREKQALTKQIQDLKHKNTRLESEKQDLKQNNTLLESEKQELVEENASLVEKLKKRGRRRRDRRNQRMDTAPDKKNPWTTNNSKTSISSGNNDSVKQQNNGPPSLVSEGTSLSLDSSNADVSPPQAPSIAHVPSADSPPFTHQHQQPPPFGYYNILPDSFSYAQADNGMPCPPYYPMYAPGYGYNESDYHQFHGEVHGNNNADGFVPNEQFEDSDHGEEGTSFPPYYPMYVAGYGYGHGYDESSHRPQLYGEAQGNNTNACAQNGEFGGNGCGEGEGGSYQAPY